MLLLLWWWWIWRHTWNGKGVKGEISMVIFEVEVVVAVVAVVVVVVVDMIGYLEWGRSELRNKYGYL